MTKTAEAVECDQCLTTLRPADCLIALTEAIPGKAGPDYEEVRVCSYCFSRVKIAMVELFKKNMDYRMAFLDERLQALQVEG